MTFSAIAGEMPKDEAGWGQWFLEHAREHRSFTGVLLAQTPSVATAEFPIDRMDDPEDWLNAHMEMSQSVWSGAGGGQCTDLRTVEWSDEQQLNQWLLVHEQWHATMRDTLGL